MCKLKEFKRFTNYDLIELCKLLQSFHLGISSGNKRSHMFYVATCWTHFLPFECFDCYITVKINVPGENLKKASLEAVVMFPEKV